MKHSDISANPKIAAMTDEIVNICDPIRVYYVSGKYNNKNELTSFKLCVVAEDDVMPEQLETKLLLGTDCDIPCDFIVYNKSDWLDCAEDDCSFAYRVENSGVLLYGKM